MSLKAVLKVLKGSKGSKKDILRKILKKGKKGLFWRVPPKVQKWDKSGKKGPKTPFFCTLWSF